MTNTCLRQLKRSSQSEPIRGFLVWVLMFSTFLSLWLLWGSQAGASPRELGVLFTKVNVYGHTDVPPEGRKLLVRAKKAYVVEDSMRTDTDQKLFQIIHTTKKLRIRGEGWTALGPHELRNPEQVVEVFEEPFSRKGPAHEPIRVKGREVSLLNQTEPSKRFPQIIWQKIKYNSIQPAKVWVPARTGIFRPGKSPSFLSEAYSEMRAKGVPKKKLERLLLGVVRVGDSKQEVEWALGKPLGTQEDTSGETNRATWQYPSLNIKFKDGVVEVFNG